MRIFIQAVGQGKAVQVFDKIANKYAYDDFLEVAAGAVDLEVASQDGSAGLVDIKKGSTAPPNTISRNNYAVKLDEVVPISDGQD